MSRQFEKLKKLLAELFQFDHADLDFGIYRIMNAKRDEISRFLEKDLLPQVKEILGQIDEERQKSLEKELARLEKQLKDAGVDPEQSPKVKELRAKLQEMTDQVALEEEVYSHLYTFFSRYYDEGDFISKRRYKENVYAIPYNGEEVKLYWANHDQYYIKTSEYFRNYAFKLPSGRRVRFEVVQAEADRDNIKTNNSKKRRFVLHKANPIAEGTNELVIRFEYRPDDRKQEEINKAIVEYIFSETNGFEDWKKELKKPCPTSKNKDRTILEKHLADFTARNTFDYFIHKDLGGFLRRELDFYIKNEVVHLDDIEDESAPRVEQYLAKVKAIRRIGHKIIDFLAQLENFQKKLWLKKKFIWETQYCITLDRIFAIKDKEKRDWLIECIRENREQIEEWKKLYHVHEIKGNLVQPGWSEPLTIEFLKAHPYLVVDTRHFDEEFKLKLISCFDNLDEELDGLLVHGENFQALNLFLERFSSSIKVAYYDPPYNTSEETFIYKNKYRHSSWLTMMENRIAVTCDLLSEDGVIIIAIDDEELYRLKFTIDSIFGEDNYLGTIVVQSNPRGRGIHTFYATAHDYYLVYARNAQRIKIIDQPLTEEQIREYRYSDEVSEYRLLPFRRSGGLSTPFERPNFEYTLYYSKSIGRIFAVGGKREQDYPAKYRPSKILCVFGDEFKILELSPSKFWKLAPKDTIEIFPIDSEGNRRVWRWSDRKKTLEAAFKGDFVVQFNKDRILVLLKDRIKEGRKPKTIWIDSKYDASSHGTNLLQDIFGNRQIFGYPKSIYSTQDILHSIAGKDKNSVIIDSFAGSGTTAHAVINLNREDGGKRKYILVEVADYFDTVLLPRIKKVVYSRDWKDGKPKPDKDGNLNGISHFLKYIRLESYEDTLNNLELRRTEIQQKLLYENQKFREDYILRYMLEFEARESLLNIKRFEDPFNYEMEISTTTVGDTRRVKVDLVDTFNYLLGLRVQTIDHIRGVRVITGENPQGEKVLILWRNIKEMDAEELNKWFKKQGYNTKDQEFDIIYVNGDNYLENLRREDLTWKVRLIEEEFLKRMFEVKDV